MKKVIAPIILLLLAINSIAQIKNTVTNSIITFQIKNLGINTGGSLGGLQTTIQFNPANLPASSIEATVDVNTINTSNDMRDNHLREDTYFDVANFPKITMKSVSFKHKSGNNYTGVFNLTMKGHTKPVEVAFTYTETAASRSFKGSFKLDRTDFGVGEKSMIMASDVTVNLEVEIAKG
jgi:polyisoprenoid-binding protein YceI